MYVNKWHTFGVSALLQCTAGVSYCFAIYAGALKESLGLTQAQVRPRFSHIPLFFSTQHSTSARGPSGEDINTAKCAIALPFAFIAGHVLALGRYEKLVAVLDRTYRISLRQRQARSDVGMGCSLTDTRHGIAAVGVPGAAVDAGSRV